MKTNEWAIRDIKHGKTFYFETLQKLIIFVMRLEQNEKAKYN